MWVSTRGQVPPCGTSEAIQRGLAADGGLFVPQEWPSLQFEQFQACLDFPSFAEKILTPFFVGDPLAKVLPQICQKAFNFPLPLKAWRDSNAILELFHGPTCAFKDVGARFLALTMANLPTEDKCPRKVMVATSGDTGGAVAAAFCELTDIPVLILFPKGKISSRQEKQLTVWGDAVTAVAVEGSFDDCQKLVKEALASDWWQSKFSLISANSINIARLLPQMCYFAFASLQFKNQRGQAPGFIIPSGNAGNAAAALWAQRLGFPIREVVFAHNANRAVPDFFATGQWNPRAMIATLANAMDVGHPSNFERVRHLFPDLENLRSRASAASVSDRQIEDTIRQEANEVLCPHTATAAYVALHHPPGRPWVIVATAHPAKFETIVEPLRGAKVPIPRSLQELLGKPSRRFEIPAQMQALQNVISSPKG